MEQPYTASPERQLAASISSAEASVVACLRSLELELRWLREDVGQLAKALMERG